jgi:hypothetical protein
VTIFFYLARMEPGAVRLGGLGVNELSSLTSPAFDPSTASGRVPDPVAAVIRISFLVNRFSVLQPMPSQPWRPSVLNNELSTRIKAKGPGHCCSSSLVLDISFPRPFCAEQLLG